MSSVRRLLYEALRLKATTRVNTHEPEPDANEEKRQSLLVQALVERISRDTRMNLERSYPRAGIHGRERMCLQLVDRSGVGVSGELPLHEPNSNETLNWNRGGREWGERLRDGVTTDRAERVVQRPHPAGELRPVEPAVEVAGALVCTHVGGRLRVRLCIAPPAVGVRGRRQRVGEVRQPQVPFDRRHGSIGGEIRLRW